MSPHHASQPPAAESVRQRLDLTALATGRIVFIGIGGIGLYLCRPVVTFLQGVVGLDPSDQSVEIVLCDGDSFGLENLYRLDVPEFGNKAAVVGQRLLQQIDSEVLTVRWICDYVRPENITTIIREGDVVMLACDNHRTRQLVGSRSCELANVVLISGGNDGVEGGQRGTYGNVQVHIRRAGVDVTAPLTAYHPEIAEPADASPAELDCLQLAVHGVPQLTFTNLAVASAMANALLRVLMPIAGEPPYDELSLDVLDGISQPVVAGTLRVPS